MGPRPEGRGGALDGMTVLRFAHIFKSSNGGMELYLRSLNRALLQRNRMTIVQMHLVREAEAQEVEVERMGEGTLVWVPSLLCESPIAPPPTLKARVKRALCRGVSGSAALAACLGRFLSHGFLLYDASVCNRRLVEFLDEAAPDLVALHWVSHDCRAVVDGARQRKIPYLVINHFDNRRFTLPLMKRCLVGAAAYGGVSTAGVPAALREDFLDFSDGIDTDFFAPAGVLPPAYGVILLPSRVTPSKGHSDLIRAAALLKEGGVRAKVVFAGREESPSFARELKGLVARLGLEEETVFAGHVSPGALREWYGASSVVALPSLSEGLGRVLLEAQAMERPVLAYDVGGVSCAMEDGCTGYLLPKGDFRALAHMTRLLLADPERRGVLGHNGRVFVQEHFSLAALARRHEEIYLRVCAPGAARGTSPPPPGAHPSRRPG